MIFIVAVSTMALFEVAIGVQLLTEQKAARPCQAAQPRASVASDGGFSGEEDAMVELTDLSPRVCTLKGFPYLAAWTLADRPFAFGVGHFDGTNETVGHSCGFRDVAQQGEAVDETCPGQQARAACARLSHTTWLTGTTTASSRPFGRTPVPAPVTRMCVLARFHSLCPSVWSQYPSRASQMAATLDVLRACPAPPTGKLRSRLAPVPGRVPIGHDVPVDALSSAGLGLDYGTVRLGRTTQAWLVAGSRLREEVRASPGPLVAGVEQIGSSSVPGLLSKPIVDLAAGLAEADGVAAVTERMEYMGWVYRGDAGDNGGHVFVLEDRPWHRVAHLHVVEHDGTQWRRYMRFRDLLTRSSDARERYEVLKSRLANQHGTDRKAYTDGNTEVVKELLAEFG